MTIRTLYLIIFVLASNSCTERIDLFSGARPTLVIDGSITNEPGPQSVRLSYSAAFNEIIDYTAVSQANVRIVDDLGNEETLSHLERGFYSSSENFQGTIGRSYQLKIEMETGEKYESSFETILPVALIDQAQFEIVDDEVVFKINFEDDVNEKNYYRWRFVGTYQVLASETNNPSNNIEMGGFACRVLAKDRFKDCWAEDFDVEYLKISDDQLINGEKQEGFEIYRRVKEEVHFAIRYSSLIKQYSLSRGAYRFWRAISDQMNNNGSIFDTSDYLIVGNVKNIDDSNEPVLGYFGASAVSSKRVFVNNGDLSFEYVQYCEVSDRPGACIPRACIDCRKHSGSSVVERPDYW